MGQEPGTANSGAPAPVPTRRTPRSLEPRAEPHLQALQRGGPTRDLREAGQWQEWGGIVLGPPDSRTLVPPWGKHKQTLD